MEAAQLALAGFAPSEPFRGECPRCGEEVLAIELDGGEVVIELAEVLPEHRCPQCEQVANRGHRRSHCLRCGGSQTLGEPLPIVGVAVDEFGRARRYRRRLREGEAAHRLHTCAV